jgi:AraC-like DNA-binding protein
MVQEGEAKVRMKGKVYELTPGHIYIIPPFVLHNYECEGHFCHYYFHVYEKPSSQIRFFEEYNFPFELNTSEMDRILFTRLLNINPGLELSRPDPQYYDNPDTLLRTISANTHNPYYILVESQGLLCQIFSRFLRYAVRKVEIGDDRILKVLGYIRKNIGKAIALEELSSLCFLSTDHLIRIFKQELDDTPLSYINKRKIEKAQLLLITTDQMVKDIACELAFNNFSYFSRLFRNIVGVTPQVYRHNCHRMV